MSASFRKVDYSIRPAKHAERRILSEVFRRLRPFQAVENYRYIGLGSLWFSDFILFHKALGIRNMISIERSQGARERIEANKPFSCITVEYRKSSDVLPGLEWDRPYFVWLDYDDPLSPDMLLDTQTVASHAVSGTALAVTVQCQQAPDIAAAAVEEGGISPLNRFRDRFGRSRVAPTVSEEDLYGWPFGQLSRDILHAEIDSALVPRNSASQSAAMVFKSICDIEYEDGAKMTTIIGVFVSSGDNETFAQCGFDQLDFLTGDSGPIRILVPILTLREIRQLERQLPREADGLMEIGSIPERDANRFARMYRYFPNFAVIDH